MEWLIWVLLFPGCLVASGWVLRGWVRRQTTETHVERAHAEFRLRREGLEARFLDILARTDPLDRVWWDDADWQDEVLWARDRQSGRLLALVGVYFENDPFVDPIDHPPRHVTVLFEYAQGRWRTEGRYLDEIHPHEAFLRHQQFEPLIMRPARRP